MVVLLLPVVVVGAATVADGNCVTVDVAIGVVPCIWF
jgi:hypothetical protein